MWNPLDWIPCDVQSDVSLFLSITSKVSLCFVWLGSKSITMASEKNVSV